MALYQEFDENAANTATRYVRQQENLKQFAKTYARTIEQRSYPTPIHKLGAKLDIYEPSIPQQWLESLVYQQGVSYNMTKLSHLPVDVRVAIMNYLDQKHLMESLSGTIENASMVSRGISQDFVRR